VQLSTGTQKMQALLNFFYFLSFFLSFLSFLLFFSQFFWVRLFFFFNTPLPFPFFSFFLIPESAAARGYNLRIKLYRNNSDNVPQGKRK
jgi:hypothetical protein